MGGSDGEQPFRSASCVSAHALPHRFDEVDGASPGDFCVDGKLQPQGCKGDFLRRAFPQDWKRHGAHDAHGWDRAENRIGAPGAQGSHGKRAGAFFTGRSDRCVSSRLRRQRVSGAPRAGLAQASRGGAWSSPGDR